MQEQFIALSENHMACNVLRLSNIHNIDVVVNQVVVEAIVPSHYYFTSLPFRLNCS